MQIAREKYSFIISEEKKAEFTTKYDAEQFMFGGLMCIRSERIFDNFEGYIEFLISTKENFDHADGSKKYLDSFSDNELDLLKSLSFFISTQAFGDGSSEGKDKYKSAPVDLMLGYVCPTNFSTNTSLKEEEYLNFKSKMLPMLTHLNTVAAEQDKKVVLTLEINAFFDPTWLAWNQLLFEHANELTQFSTIFFNTYNSSDHLNHSYKHINFKSTTKAPFTKPEERGEKFKECLLASILDADPISKPGNNYTYARTKSATEQTTVFADLGDKELVPRLASYSLGENIKATEAELSTIKAGLDKHRTEITEKNKADKETAKRKQLQLQSLRNNHQNNRRPQQNQTYLANYSEQDFLELDSEMNRFTKELALKSGKVETQAEVNVMHGKVNSLRPLSTLETQLRSNPFEKHKLNDITYSYQDKPKSSSSISIKLPDEPHQHPSIQQLQNSLSINVDNADNDANIDWETILYAALISLTLLGLAAAFIGTLGVFGPAAAGFAGALILMVTGYVTTGTGLMGIGLNYSCGFFDNKEPVAELDSPIPRLPKL